MAKKTKLRSGWEKSFEDFVELSGATLTPAQHSNNTEHDDEHMRIDEDDDIADTAVESTTTKVFYGSPTAFPEVPNIPNSPDIDNFIHKILNVAESGQAASANDVDQTETVINSPTSTPCSTQSIDRFIKEVIAPTPGDFLQSLDVSSELKEVVEGGRVGHLERSHDFLSSALLFSSTESHVSCTQKEEDTEKVSPESESQASQPIGETMPSQEVDNSNFLSQSVDMDDGPTQYISNCGSSQAVGEESEDWNIANLSSVRTESTAGTPELSNRLSAVTKEVENDELDSDPTDKLESSGMAERLRKIIQREQSDQSVCRHKVMLANQQLEETPPDSHVTKLVVTETPDVGEMLVRCVIVSCTDDSLSVGSQAKLASSSLRSQAKNIYAGDELVIFWPWRILNSEAIGTVIFTASYCLLNSSTEEKERGAQATPSLVTKTINCACHSGNVALHPCYTGPRAFLLQ